MEKAVVERIEKMITEEAGKRFAGAAVQRVMLLQYGDEPVIEPGELALRIIVESGSGKKEMEQALRAFEDAYDDALRKFRDDLRAKLPEMRRMEVCTSGDDGHGPRMQLGGPTESLQARALAGANLTPVMARLGPVDLETLDTLITAGIVASRADGVRWALAKIRDRPAYGQLRDRAREIDELKAQF
jgi:hypothetical protein